jgi:hypothetical protein
MLLLIAAQLEDPAVLFPWPSLACKQKEGGGCGFPDSHRQLALLLDEQDPPPPDAASSPNPSTSQTHLRSAIQAVVEYIPAWEALPGIRPANLTGPRKSAQKSDAKNADATTLKTIRKLLEQVYKNYGIPQSYRQPIHGWLEHGIHTTVQVSNSELSRAMLMYPY